MTNSYGNLKSSVLCNGHTAIKISVPLGGKMHHKIEGMLK